MPAVATDRILSQPRQRGELRDARGDRRDAESRYEAHGQGRDEPHHHAAEQEGEDERASPASLETDGSERGAFPGQNDAQYQSEQEP